VSVRTAVNDGGGVKTRLSAWWSATRFPPLHHLPREESRDIGRRCARRLVRHPRTWVALACLMAAHASLFFLRGALASSGAWLRHAVPLLVCFAVPFLFGLLMRGVARREWVTELAARNRCTCCGYDLTGNVSRVCPECGAPLATG
jgi:hypothetical protein